MWEEEKKKKPLYKNWKLYATVLAILGIGTATGLGIYYGTTNHHSEVTKINLNTLNNNIVGTEKISNDETGNTAFEAFIEQNIKYSDLKDNVEYTSFIKPDYTTNGSLIINAKRDSKKYTGTITITISQLNKLALENLELNTNIGITLTDDDQKAAQAFLDTNNSILGNNLTLKQIKLTNFKGIKIGENGTLTITVTDENSKYTGSINITLKIRLDENSVINIMYYLSQNNQLNFQIPTGTKQADLMALITDDFRSKMSNYYIYANNIESIAVTTPRYMPTQAELDKKGTVWIPPKYDDNSANAGISLLWLGFTVYYKDGTIATPVPSTSPGSPSYLIAWNLNATITVV